MANKIKKTFTGKTDINLKFITALTRCLQSIHKREASVLKDAVITHGQFGVLELLYHKGSMPVKEIISRSLGSGGNMTVILDNLEKRHLLVRNKVAGDRRASLICLTEKGEKLIAEVFKFHIKNLSVILQELSDSEKITMTELAKKLGKSIL